MRRFLELLSLWLPLAVYMALIYALSAQSRLVWAEPFPDFLLHSVEFFLLSGLVIRALNGGLLIPIAARCYLWGFVLSSHYAMLDEIHQAFVTERVSSMFDFMADLIGIDLALAAVFILQRSLAPRRVHCVQAHPE